MESNKAPASVLDRLYRGAMMPLFEDLTFFIMVMEASTVRVHVAVTLDESRREKTKRTSNLRNASIQFFDRRSFSFSPMDATHHGAH